jgi:phage baseplate assembly protein W
MNRLYTYIGPSLYAVSNNETVPINFETVEVIQDGHTIEVVPAIKTDIDLINESVYRILTTSKGERPYLRDFGCNLKSYVFEPLDSILFEVINKEIRDVLGKWEPRVGVQDIAVEKASEHTVYITLLYYIILDQRYLIKARFIL